MGKLHTSSMNRIFLLCLATCLTTLTTVACAHSQIWNSQGVPSDYASLSESLKTHGVIILGENHGLKSHQNQHLQILKTLREQGRSLHVGLEFFSFPFQQEVDSYRLGQLAEPEFLKKIEWGGMSFDFYKPQAVFPDYSLGERTWALNAPRSLTGQISKKGIAQLPPELQKLLPPGFTLGRESYRERFKKVIGDHMTDPQQIQNFFEAQSTWDDTMAWRIATFREENPNAVMVVIVGEFHVQYGGGLPDRLKARGVNDVLVISQVNASDLKEEEIQKEVSPDPEYGPRADWIWTSPNVD